MGVPTVFFLPGSLHETHSLVMFFCLPCFYSFTYLAYSSSGTFSRFAIAICEAVNLTVLRPFGDDDFEAVAPAEATLGLLDFF
jgi:hypothetical protein